MGAAPSPEVAALVAPDLSSGRVEAFELWGDGDEATLDPAEAKVVADAVENRRRHFAAGRRCAALALARLGADREPLLPGPKRQPLWPDGFTGSISHTDGHAVALVAPLSAIGTGQTLGIDAERVGRVDEKLYDRLFLPAERDLLAALDPEPRAVAATVMFGTKEAFYKAQFPVTSAWVGFHDVELRPAGPDAFTLHRATGLAALDRFTWPSTARSLIRWGVAVTALAVTPA